MKFIRKTKFGIPSALIALLVSVVTFMLNSSLKAGCNAGSETGVSVYLTPKDKVIFIQGETITVDFSAEAKNNPEIGPPVWQDVTWTWTGEGLTSSGGSASKVFESSDAGSEYVVKVKGTFTMFDGEVLECEAETTVHVNKVEIIQPKGDAYESNNNESESWTSNFWWDFQQISTDSAGDYVIDIEGEIKPDSWSYKWDLFDEDSGTISGTTGTPNYTPPSIVTDSPEYGNIELTPVDEDGSELTDFTEEKWIVVYKDHLERDHHNFGESQTCQEETWNTPFGQVDIGINWNCHGSVLHALDGSGSGKWDIDGEDAPPPYASNPEAGTKYGKDGVFSDWSSVDVDRGEIVVYYQHPTGGISHSQICLGNINSMWGANNPNYGSWGVCSIQDYFIKVGADHFKVFKPNTRFTFPFDKIYMYHD